MIGVLTAEWTKLRTTRAAAITLAAVVCTVPLAAALTWAAATTLDDLPAGQSVSVTSMPWLTHWLAMLAMGVLGALFIATEYTTGEIRTTFTAVPRRGRVLTAKAIVVGTVTPAVAFPALWATWAVTRAVAGDRALAGIPGPLADELPGLLAMTAAVTGVALFGLGLAAILRSAVATIAVLAALWQVIPVAAQHLPAPWDDRVGSILPSGLAAQIASDGAQDSIYGTLLTPTGAVVTLLAWALLPLLIAWPLLRSRDV